MNVLLHTCCAVCTIAPYRRLTEAGHTATGFFYNPNIHPLIEFRRRLKAQKVLQEHLPIPMICDEEYGLREFLEAVDWRSARRCEDCYRLRLRRAAAEAVHRGMDAFSTTLLVSKHQNHELLRAIGEECAKEAGVPFHCEDWRPFCDEGHIEAKKLGLYHQKYCGCIFSEYERFRDTTQHLYRGPGARAE